MLKTLIRMREAPPPPADIDGVRVVPNSRARRLSLRVDAKLGDVVQTLALQSPSDLKFVD